MSSDPSASVLPAYDPERFRREGHAVVDALADYLQQASQQALPVLPHAAPAALCAEFSERLTRGSSAPLAEFVREALQRANHLHHPRYIGHQVTAPLPEAALLELVAALSN